jgi:hypothetical protein
MARVTARRPRLKADQHGSLVGADLLASFGHAWVRVRVGTSGVGRGSHNYHINLPLIKLISTN